MRLLQISVGDGDVVDLHPAMSIVTGLHDAGRATLVAAVAGLPSGKAVTAGLVEAHDVRFELTDEVLDLLELADPAVDPVLGPGALDGLDGDDGDETQDQDLAGAEHRARAAIAAIGPVRDALDAAWARAERSDREAPSDRVVAAAGAAADAAADLDRALAAARTAAATAAAADEARVAARTARADLAAALEERRAALAADDAGQAVPGTAGRAEAHGGGSVVVARRAALEERRHELAVLVAVLEDGPPPGVADEVADLAQQAAAVAEQVDPDPVAGALADELVRIGDRLADLPEQQLEAAAVDAARARLELARGQLLDAEPELRDHELGEAARSVERAHEELHDAIEAASRPFRSRARAQERIEAARAAEAAALARLGYGTYTEYLTGGARPRTVADDAGVDEARAELAAAEAAWAEVEAAVALELRRAELEARRQAVLEEAAAVLGDAADDPVETERRLRAVVVPRRPDHAALLDALTRAGLVLGDADLTDLDHDDLVVLAGALVDEVPLSEARREAAVAELATVHAELAGLDDDAPARAGLTAAGPGAGDPADDPVDDPVDDRAGDAGPGMGADDDHAVADDAAERAETARRGAALAAAEAAVADAAEAEREASGTADAAERARAAATAAVEAAERGLVAARADLRSAQLSTRSPAAPVAPPVGGRPADRQAADDGEIEVTEAAVREATAALWAAERAAWEALAELDRARKATRVDADAAARGGAEEVERALGALEGRVLARIAAQRSLSYAGGVPLVLDRCLDRLDPDLVGPLLERLEPTATAVQLIVISEAEAPVRWAEAVGPHRAAVVRPAPPGS